MLYKEEIGPPDPNYWEARGFNLTPRKMYMEDPKNYTPPNTDNYYPLTDFESSFTNMVIREFGADFLPPTITLRERFEELWGRKIGPDYSLDLLKLSVPVSIGEYTMLFEYWRGRELPVISGAYSAEDNTLHKEVDLFDKERAQIYFYNSEEEVGIKGDDGYLDFSRIDWSLAIGSLGEYPVHNNGVRARSGWYIYKFSPKMEHGRVREERIVEQNDEQGGKYVLFTETRGMDEETLYIPNMPINSVMTDLTDMIKNLPRLTQ